MHSKPGIDGSVIGPGGEGSLRKQMFFLFRFYLFFHGNEYIYLGILFISYTVHIKSNVFSSLYIYNCYRFD